MDPNLCSRPHPGRGRCSDTPGCCSRPRCPFWSCSFWMLVPSPGCRGTGAEAAGARSTLLRFAAGRMSFVPFLKRVLARPAPILHLGSCGRCPAWSCLAGTPGAKRPAAVPFPIPPAPAFSGLPRETTCTWIKPPGGRWRLAGSSGLTFGVSRAPSSPSTSSPSTAWMCTAATAARRPRLRRGPKFQPPAPAGGQGGNSEPGFAAEDFQWHQHRWWGHGDRAQCGRAPRCPGPTQGISAPSVPAETPNGAAAALQQKDEETGGFFFLKKTVYSYFIKYTCTKLEAMSWLGQSSVQKHPIMHS